MKWFEEEIEDVIGSDDKVSGSSPRQIAKIADEVLGEAEMFMFMRDFFVSQKSLGEFLGVGESTVAGWVKNRSFPDYAKRASVAAYYARKYHEQLLKLARDWDRPKIVKDGDRYLIVRFSTDERDVTIGHILARDIPSEKTALILASGLKAWQLLERAEDLIDHELESMDPEDSKWIQDLKDELDTERNLTFNPDEFLQMKKRRAAEIQKLFDDLVIPGSDENKSSDPDKDGESKTASDQNP